MFAKLKTAIFIVTILCLGLSGCSSTEPADLNSGGSGLNPAGPSAGNETPTEAVGCLLPGTPPPYLGMWSLEGEDGPQVAVFTETSFYLVETGKMVGEAGGFREQFAEVTAIDLQNSHVTLMTRWIRMNGKMVAIDSPQIFLSYKVENEMLSFGTSTEAFPTELQYGPFAAE